MYLLNQKSTIYSSLIIQSGANQYQNVSIHIEAMDAKSLGLRTNPTINVVKPSGEDIFPLIGILDEALLKVSMARADLGAMQNRLEFKMHNIANQSENISAAESRIRDADMAAEMTEFTRNNILHQSSTAMLAQANALPQTVLQLLG